MLCDRMDELRAAGVFVFLKVRTERGYGTLIAERAREFANFLRVLFQKKIGAKLGFDVFRKRSAQDLLSEAVRGGPLAAVEFGRAAEKTKRCVDAV